MTNVASDKKRTLSTVHYPYSGVGHPLAAVLRAEVTDSVEPSLPRRRNMVAMMARFKRLALLATTSVFGEGGRADWPSGRRFSNTLRMSKTDEHPHILLSVFGRPTNSEAKLVIPDRAGGVTGDDDCAMDPARPPG